MLQKSIFLLCKLNFSKWKIQYWLVSLFNSKKLLWKVLWQIERPEGGWMYLHSFFFFSSPVFWTGWTQWNSQTIFQWNRLVHWNWDKNAVTLKTVMGFCFGSFYLFIYFSFHKLEGTSWFWYFLDCLYLAWVHYDITLFFYWCLNPITPNSSWQ